MYESSVTVVSQSQISLLQTASPMSKIKLLLFKPEELMDDFAFHVGLFVCLVLNYTPDVRNHIPKSKQGTCFVTTNQLLNGIKIKLLLRLVHIGE